MLRNKIRAYYPQAVFWLPIPGVTICQAGFSVYEYTTLQLHITLLWDYCFLIQGRISTAQPAQKRTNPTRKKLKIKLGAVTQQYFLRRLPALGCSPRNGYGVSWPPPFFKLTASRTATPHVLWATCRDPG
ncbi:MAG: hypothetical protein RIS47_2005 [Bacteroidota bacterium]|jgi:hypothetical protein